LCFVQLRFGCCNRTIAYRDEEVVGVFIAFFSCAAGSSNYCARGTARP
jgi:hypothetical protein